jgi:hypothetical protein
MKVIQQLIEYFRERGKLTQKQLNQLVAKGWTHQYSPADLPSLESRIGESFLFQVSGNLQGPLWGTDTYTSDSHLGTACVHAGLLQDGEAGVVKVKIVKPIPIFRGSSRNGVKSHDWTTGWSGAFQVEHGQDTSASP